MLIECRANLPPPQLPSFATFASKSRNDFHLNFVRAFSATFRDFSAMNLQSNPGNRLIINERNSGNLVQRDSRFNYFIGDEMKVVNLKNPFDLGKKSS